MGKLVLVEELFLTERDAEHNVPVKYELSSNGTHKFNYFACTCDSEVRQNWKHLIAEEFKEHNPDEDADIFSQLVMDLNWSYDAYISSIGADQWFGLSVKLEANVDGKYCPVEIYMQCDELTIGLFAVIEILKKIIDLG